MKNRAVKDEIDEGMTNLVFDDGNRERTTWRCCSNTVVPRSEITFFVQVSTLVLMTYLCLAMLFLISEGCEEKSIWIALLSCLVDYSLPNPKL